MFYEKHPYFDWRRRESQNKKQMNLTESQSKEIVLEKNLIQNLRIEI